MKQFLFVQKSLRKVATEYFKQFLSLKYVPVLMVSSKKV